MFKKPLGVIRTGRVKINRGDVKFETSVLVKSPCHLLLQKSGSEGQNGKRKHIFWGHNYCFKYELLD